MTTLIPMSEPNTRAERIEPIMSGVFWWGLADDRLDGARSEAYAVRSDDGRVALVDPLPVGEELLRGLGEVGSIVLTAACHQRSAWRFRRAFGATVYAPEGAEGMEEQPDFRYAAGEALPLGLVPFFAPGPAHVMYALWRSQPRPVLFLADLLFHDGSGIPGFIESAYQDDPRRTRVSVQRLLEKVPAEVLCFAHGPPILEHGARALRAALERDTELAGAPAT